MSANRCNRGTSVPLTVECCSVQQFQIEYQWAIALPNLRATAFKRLYLKAIGPEGWPPQEITLRIALRIAPDRVLAFIGTYLSGPVRTQAKRIC
jgi:hypothetical protein